MPELVRTVVTDGVAMVTMGRAEARNALSPELIAALEAAITTLEARMVTTAGVDPVGTDVRVNPSPEIRAVILGGDGKAFCAGMDLKGVLSDPVKMAGMLRGLARTMARIRRLPVPTISRVQGAAVGGGCGLMVVTDFAFTHPDAKVGYPEVDLGVCPAVVAPWLMRKIGPGRARAMLLSGGTMSGEEGFKAGLATHLVPQEQLESAALDFARKLAKGAPLALAVTKYWSNELDRSMDDGPLMKAAELSAKVIAGAEAQERLRKIFG